MKFKLVICMAVLLFATMAFADGTNFTAVGPGAITGSWQQGFIENNVGNFNQMQFVGITGSTFEAPGVNGYSTGGWVTTFSPTDLASLGTDTNYLAFNINFTTDQPDAFSFYGYAYNGSTVVDAALFNWTGSTWNITGTNQPAPPAVPEPATIALFGSGLAVIARRLRKRS